jgi:hypothetical protein
VEEEKKNIQPEGTKAEAIEKEKPGEKAPEEGEKPGEKAPEEGEKPGEKAPEEGEKPGEKAPEEKEKAGEKAPEEGEKPGEKAPEEKEKSEKKKGDSRMPKSTKPPKPGECAGCGKPISKRLWYYRDLSFYCTKKCYKRKLEADRKKAAEEAASAEGNTE